MAKAGGLDDFSNNLATDLGPLLSLFGDAITKQYLSESTSFEDYVIFALAPIGLMTAVVSVIRVCGGPWLRSFIGRAQEGDAAIEAELCTSTSADICEVFNRGGITRTLGKAKILEIIRVRPGANKDEDTAKSEDDDKNNSDKPKSNISEKTSEMEINYDWSQENMGLFLVRDYFANCRTSEWHHHTGAKNRPWLRAFSRRRASQNTDTEKGVNPAKDKTISSQNSALAKNSLDKYSNINPNLSINVGIRKRGPLFVYSVLVLGIVLQLGLLAMAPLMSWVGNWSKDGHSKQELGIQKAYAKNKIPISFLVGNVVMILGMFGCAYLIGQITEELKYRRINDQKSTELYWVQAGDQVIGDQTYGPYAYSDPSKPLTEYVISTKRENMETVFKYKVLTWITIVATLGGYIVQFVGLRGMTAWVSIAQLAIMLIMSFFRGMMRTQRLANNGNKLQDISEEVVGHELDWLAFEIWKTMRRDKNGTQKADPLKKDSAQKDGQASGMSWIFTGQPISNQPLQPVSTPALNHAEEILRIRARLGYLSGHESDFLLQTEKTQRQNWDGKYVPIRARAMKMAKALSAIANRLIDKNHPKTEIHLRFQVAFSRSPRDTKPDLHTIGITLHPPNLVARQRTWSLDSLQLEAILGLFSWSLSRYPEVKSPQSGRNSSPWIGFRTSTAKSETMKDVSRARILSARRRTKAVSEDKQYLLDLWLGDNTAEIESCTLRWQQTDQPTCKTLWRRTSIKDKEAKKRFLPDRPESNYRPLQLSTSSSESIASAESPPLQFLGWTQVNLESGPPDSTNEGGVSARSSRSELLSVICIVAIYGD